MLSCQKEDAWQTIDTTALVALGNVCLVCGTRSCACGFLSHGRVFIGNDQQLRHLHEDAKASR